MSALAKVFVVFVFILSVVFFGTSATLFKIRYDWKTAYMELKQANTTAVNELEQRITELRGEVDRTATELSNTKYRADQLAAEKLKLTSDLEQEKSNVEAARTELGKMVTLMEQNQRNLQERDEKITSLESQISEKELQRSNAVENARVAKAERDSMRLDLQKTTQELSTARTEYASLSDKYDTLELLAQRYQTQYGPLVGPTLPPIDALVNAVDNEEQLVVLSKGKDDEVKTGYKFTVYRGDQFIGKVQVIKVYPNLCGARILFTKDDLQIRRGDTASTRVGVN